MVADQQLLMMNTVNGEESRVLIVMTKYLVFKLLLLYSLIDAIEDFMEKIVLICLF